MKELFSKLYELLQNGENAVLCSIIESFGSTPRKAGAKMLVYGDGEMLGTIGGGIVEFNAINTAKELLKTKESKTETFSLNREEVLDSGMVCGGKVTVYFRCFSHDNNDDKIVIKAINDSLLGEKNLWLITEICEGKKGKIFLFDKENGVSFSKIGENEIKPYIKNNATLINKKYFADPLVSGGFVYVFGGGHISQALVPVISKVDFRAIVVEDREKFADKNLFDGVHSTILTDFSKVKDKIKVTDNDYIVIMTRGHEKDFEILEFALSTKATYIGLIGSRHKWAYTEEKLRSDGYTKSDIERVINPIGLHIMAQTPNEIAISIAAQMIKHRAEN